MGGWNEAMGNEFFNPEEESLIRIIPLSNTQGEDKLIWWRSRNGMFSVRSAYYGVMEDLVNTNHRVLGNWRHIWRLKIPQKLKILLWLIACGYLPIHDNHRQRHVPCDHVCPMCETGVEDELHIFLKCQHAIHVWHIGSISHVKNSFSQAASFNDCFFSLLELLMHEQQVTFTMMFWILWKRRNEKVWENISKPGDVSIQLAMEQFI